MNSPNIVVTAEWGPMIINKNDINIGRSIQRIGSWDHNDLDLISKVCDRMLQHKQTIVLYDIGANIGSHCIPIAKKYGNKINIRAFEAQRQIFHMLCGNVALNDLNNIVCEHIAVSDKANQTLKIKVPDYHTENNFGGLELVEALNSDNQNMKKPNEEEVNTIILDYFSDAVDFIKMDIEGMEHLALSGANMMLKNHRPFCFVEIRKTDLEKVTEIFNSLDYEVYKYSEFDWLFFPKESKYWP